MCSGLANVASCIQQGQTGVHSYRMASPNICVNRSLRTLGAIQTKGRVLNLQENLHQLMARRRRQLARSYEAMADIATKAGHPISGSMIHTLATKPLINIPTTASLRALAVGMDVLPREVLDAAAESINMEPVEVEIASHVRAVITLLADRTPEEVAALEGFLRALPSGDGQRPPVHPSDPDNSDA